MRNLSTVYTMLFHFTKALKKSLILPLERIINGHFLSSFSMMDIQFRKK